MAAGPIISGVSASFDVAGFLAEPGDGPGGRGIPGWGAAARQRLVPVRPGGRFWFSSHPSTPFGAAAVRRVEVAVLVDEFAPPDRIRQVRVRGPARVEQPDRARVATLYGRYLGPDAESWPAFFRAASPTRGWSLWWVPPETGVATINPGFRPSETRWHRRRDAPLP